MLGYDVKGANEDEILVRLSASYFLSIQFTLQISRVLPSNLQYDGSPDDGGDFRTSKVGRSSQRLRFIVRQGF